MTDEQIIEEMAGLLADSFDTTKSTALRVSEMLLEIVKANLDGPRANQPKPVA
jgi:hypothetical protein